MFTRLLSLFTIIGLIFYSSSYADTISNLPSCQLDKNLYDHYWNNCFGSQSFNYFPKGGGNYVRYGYPNMRINGFANIYTGEWKSGKPDGYGEIIFADGSSYKGQWINGFFHGNGYFVHSLGSEERGVFVNGRLHEGVRKLSNGLEADFKNGQPISSYEPSKGNQNLSKSQNNTPATKDIQRLESDRTKSQLDQERQQLAEERRKLEEDKRQREQAKTNQRITLQINNTQPSAEGDVTINIQTNADTASLKINGEEQGGRADGKYSVMRVARAGQETSFEIYAKDIYGNTDTKIVTVRRTMVESKVSYPILNPASIKRQPERDAVAVIIGISNYKSLPKADYAKDDAQVFSDYAIRALGVRPGNIKLLMEEQADADEIYTAFKTWLPARVKSTTDVYVFYSGHGLPTKDGSGLYWLPQRANRDVISKTAILLQDINSDILASKPKSVTIFMDACYSGQARGGETLVASARPIALKSQPTTFPSNFTVISASQADQISSSSPELQHGIFSYYLMRGMEGEADLNKDGKITLNEIQAYLSENVGRQARIMNRQQEPQVIGDGSKVLVGR